MRFNFSDIWEGWRNHLLPSKRLRKVILRVSSERMAICREGPCEWHSDRHATMRADEHCVECGCPLLQKSKCLSCGCGIHKWEAVLTEEQEAEINIERHGK